MRVEISPRAQRKLESIWRRNAQDFGPAQADEYRRFLKSEMVSLAARPERGRPAPENPAYRYFVALFRSGGHGHVIVYRLYPERVFITHLFHTSEDWPRKLS